MVHLPVEGLPRATPLGVEEHRSAAASAQLAEDLRGTHVLRHVHLVRGRVRVRVRVRVKFGLGLGF